MVNKVKKSKIIFPTCKMQENLVFTLLSNKLDKVGQSFS